MFGLALDFDFYLKNHLLVLCICFVFVVDGINVIDLDLSLFCLDGEKSRLSSSENRIQPPDVEPSIEKETDEEGKSLMYYYLSYIQLK